MTVLLKKLMKQNGKGYVFSLDGGGKPVCRKYFYDEFHRALNRIGIDRGESRRRGLSIHSWRHFLNTELQKQGLSLQQVQAVTGHKSDRMTEWYSHFDARQLADVMEAQHVITGIKKPGTAGEAARKAADKTGRVVSFPAQKNIRKRA
jgi:integrase